MPQHQHHKIYSIFTLILATVIWGSTFLVVKNSLAGINAIALVGYRCALSAILLAIGLVVLKKCRIFADFKSGFILGLTMTILYLAQTIGLYYTTPFNAGFITGLFVVFTPIFHFIFWREKTTWLNIFAITLSALGLWFVTGGIKHLNFGDLLMLFSAIAFSFQIIFAGKFVQEGKNPAILTFQQFFVTAIICLAIMFLWHLPWQITRTTSYYELAYLVIFASILCYIAQFAAQKYITTIFASMIITLEPVFAAIFAWTLGSEPFVWIKSFGGVLIIIAMLLVIIAEQQKRKFFLRLLKVEKETEPL